MPQRQTALGRPARPCRFLAFFVLALTIAPLAVGATDSSETSTRLEIHAPSGGADAAGLPGDDAYQRNASHIAIIPGDGPRALAAELLDLIEGAALSRADVRFVERQKILDILKEQRLNMSGLTNPDVSIETGRLLSADILLILERIIMEGQPVVQFLFIDTQTGIRLLSRLVPEEDILNDPAAVGGIISQVQDKVRVPLNQRYYVSILEFQSEEPGDFLNDLADAMRVILENDISQIPQMIVLDREHMEYITREGELTGKALDLKKSVVLLEGGIRRDPGNQQMIQTVRLRALDKKELGFFQVKSPIEKPFANRKEILAAIIDKMDGIQQEIIIPDQEKEAQLFALQSIYFLTQRDHVAATRSAEAAMALNPSPENHELVMQAWYHRARSVRHGFANYDYWPIVARGQRSEARQISPGDQRIMFEAEIRCAQSTLSYLKKYPIRNLKATYVGTYLNYVQVQDHGALFLPVNHQDQERMSLRRELQELRIAIFKKAFEQESREVSDSKCSSLLGVGIQMAPYWADGVERYIALVKEMVKLWNRQGGVNDSNPMLSFPYHLTRSFFAMREDYPDRASQIALERLRQWLGIQTDPLIKLIALKIKCCNENAERTINLINKHKLYLQGRDDYFLEHMVFQCYRLYQAERLDKLCVPFLSDLAQESAGPQIDSYKETIQQCLQGYQKYDKNKSLSVERLAFLQGIITTFKDLFASLEEDRPQDMTLSQIENNLDYFVRIESEFFGKGRNRQPLPDGNSLGDNFAMQQIPLQVPEGFRGIEKILQYQNSLIVVWRTWDRFDHYHYQNKKNGGPFSIRVMRIPLRGGAPSWQADFTVSIPPEIKVERITCLAAEDDRIVMGTTESGLIMCQPGECRQYRQEDGLPSNDIASLGWYQGKLFVGHGLTKISYLQGTGGGGGLSSFDPQTGKIEIIFSSKSQDKKFVLDNIHAYRVSGLLADADRNCLWLGIGGIRDTVRFTERYWDGLWRFEPDTGQLERVWQSDDYFDFSTEMFWWKDPDPFAWWKDPYIFGGTDYSIILMDLEQENVIHLVHEKSLDAVFGNGDEIQLPRALLKEYLVSFTNEKLRFYSKDHKAAAVLEKTPNNREIENVTEMIMLDDASVIAVINERELWRIREKSVEDLPAPRAEGRETLTQIE